MSELIDRQAFRAAHGLGSDCHDCKRDMKSCQYDRDYSLMDFCEWLDDAPTASPWHRVEDELPEKFVNVILANKRGKHYDIDKGWWNGYSFDRCAKGIYRNVTHWMPLPEPPKEDA